MDSPEWISQPELRRRLREIVEATAHLRLRLPPDSPYNAALRLEDVAVYIRAQPRRLQSIVSDVPPPRCIRHCASVNDCRLKPRCRAFQDHWQRDLSRFFWAWDRGALVKARVNDVWRIIPKNPGDPALEKMVATPATAPAPRPPLKLKIYVTTLGPRLRQP